MEQSVPRRSANPGRQGRAQCIVHREGRILLVHHVHAADAYWVLPGGGIEADETPADAAIREMAEECSVTATIERELSRITAADGQTHYTFLVDIGQQNPQLGAEDADEQRVLQELAWKSTDELEERERLHLWSAGHHLPTDQYPVSGATPCPAEAGDVLFFSYLTIHGSGLNESQEARTTLLVQMRDPADLPTVDTHVSRGQGMMLRGIDPLANAGPHVDSPRRLTIAAS